MEPGESYSPIFVIYGSCINSILTWLLASSSLPTATCFIAAHLGFFTANVFSVVYNQAASSPAAYISFFAEDYNDLIAFFDNALNNRLNLNENVTVLDRLNQGPDLIIASVPSINNAS